ncbi:ABC transporter substrate-binding protein [Phreatobacter sp. AB_2022a]|uniref:ABC transporter substrate-binding protein n=1 Tax=Phreatobacter sp. AB_2022a TaxID=3003134 RepID=UPI00228702CF|nr:ABC transporter substrate-binding protein [Phreatobacter sp. AB_2022a]MCZ0737843.1 ABC transporter substrate-binding protein [Phreatobacter sp. AB_2022a]
MLSRRLVVSLLAGTAMAGLPMPAPVLAAEADLSPEQKGRVRAQRVEDAIRLISPQYRFVAPGKFTVGIAAGRLPFGTIATDNRTVVGSEADLGQLVADSLGLDLAIVLTAWADWPLGVQSGRFDAVISNVTVTEERKERLDFSTYRNDLLAFFVRQDGPIQSIREPKDVAGLKVIVSSGTNQERILINWIRQNEAAGLRTSEIQYYDDDAVLQLALQSGRADAYLGPHALLSYRAALDRKTRLAGTLSGGWPLTAEIAVTTRKGAGLAEAITAALNAQIANGNYGKALARWGLEQEAITHSRTNPPGLPKS